MLCKGLQQCNPIMVTLAGSVDVSQQKRCIMAARESHDTSIVELRRIRFRTICMTSLMSIPAASESILGNFAGIGACGLTPLPIHPTLDRADPFSRNKMVMLGAERRAVSRGRIVAMTKVAINRDHNVGATACFSNAPRRSTPLLWVSATPAEAAEACRASLLQKI